MSETIKSEEISELLLYLDSIKSYDVRHVNFLSRTTMLVWGLLFYFAGLMDYFTEDTRTFEDAYPWLLCNIFGVFYSIYIHKRSQRIVFSESIKEELEERFGWVYILIIFLIILWIFSTVISGYYAFEDYYFAILSVLLALVMAYFSKDSPAKIGWNLVKNKPTLFVAIACVITSITIIIGNLINPDFHNQFGSLTFGLISGSGFLIVGLYNEKTEA